jgi:hypothetical protein
MLRHAFRDRIREACVTPGPYERALDALADAGDRGSPLASRDGDTIRLPGREYLSAPEADPLP